MKVFKYFTPEEFGRCTPPCEISDMDLHFMEILDAMRDDCGFPFKVNSAFRSPEYERKCGRTGSSSHTKGIAIDIHCANSKQRLRLVQSALAHGIERIGLYSNFVHLDIDKSKVQCFWIG